MAATTRWVNYDISAVGAAGDGRSAGGKGTRGSSIGTGTVSVDGISIGPTTNRLYIQLDGETPTPSYITLYSGSGLDPRFVARDITEKLHNINIADERWANAACDWANGPWGNGNGDSHRLRIYSGTLGSDSGVTVATSGTNSAHTVLGFDSPYEPGGANTNSTGGSNIYPGTITISGTYYGFFDEIYKIVLSNDNNGGSTRGIGTPSKDGSNTYAGTISTGGIYNASADITYTLAINTNGTTMGAGTGNVPTMTWISTASADDSDTATELLYPTHWYTVGTRGLRVKFTDAVFNTASPAWTIACSYPTKVDGNNANAALGVAQYVYSSDRGDDSSSPTTTASGSATALGTRGLSIQFTGGGGSNLYAKDEFYVICAGPLPGASANYNISSLNYGNVTVSTDSDVKAVMFEIQSGAVEMSTVKFGLQNNGTFSHHDAGNFDTYFRFGTVGPGNPKDGTEWYPNIAYTDIDSDVAPAYLYATEDNLSVVSTADASETIGSVNTGLVSDPMWLSIHLGASETGANSTVNYRLYFDYS